MNKEPVQTTHQRTHNRVTMPGRFEPHEHQPKFHTQVAERTMRVARFNFCDGEG
jgi:hypothetical protein